MAVLSYVVSTVVCVVYIYAVDGDAVFSGPYGLIGAGLGLFYKYIPRKRVQYVVFVPLSEKSVTYLVVVMVCCCCVLLMLATYV